MSYKPEEHSGAGTDTLPDSPSMPIIGIIQSGSAQFKKSHKNYSEKKIEGCEEGDIYFGADNVVLPKPVKIIPLRCQETFTQWTGDGKLVGIFGMDAAAKDDYKTWKDGNKDCHSIDGVEVNRTDYWFLKFLYNDEWLQAIIALKSTGMKMSTRIANTIKQAKTHPLYNDQAFKPPTFAVSIDLTTIADGGGGNSWFSWDIEGSEVIDYKAQGELMSDCAETQSQIKMLEATPPKEIEGETTDVAGADPEGEDKPF